MTTHRDTDLREALRRRYANTPQLPTDFTERMMERANTKPVQRHRWQWAASVAACLLIVVGIGLHHELNETSQQIVQAPSMPEVHEVVNKPIEAEAPQPIAAVEPQPIQPHRTARKSRTHLQELPDTLGNGIWRSERNVTLALKILSECATTIQREEQEVRNHIIQATFNATPQPANAVLVTNEAGDYEVIETKRIREI
ncbi:MAG: hypothetical protein J5770_07045 [Bacteroidaceae bacterium]|nr:hypothetical protein [Bacteroidaceae bacterium]